MGLHKDQSEANLHEPKLVSTATAGQTYIANGAGSGAWENAAGTKRVVVNTLSDLPTPAGGTITLVANTSYTLGASINIAGDFITFGNGSDLSSPGAFISTLTYTGTGSMLVGVDVNATVKDITLVAATAEAYNFSETGGGGAKIILISDVLIVTCLRVGTFDKVNTLVMDGTTVISCTTGLKFEGAVSTAIRLQSVALGSTDVAYVGLDFTGSTQKTVNMDGVILSGGAGSIGLKGDAASANITSGFLANINNVQFGGVTTPLSGITVDDVRWNFQNNGVVQDTMPDSLISLNANATATVLSVGVPTLVAGTWNEERVSHFSTTAAGRSTYNGERDLPSPIVVSMTLDPVSGTNKVIRAYIALNGTEITNSGQAVKIGSGDPKQLSIPWQLTLSENDFLEIFIENETDSVDVTVTDASFLVR